MLQTETDERPDFIFLGVNQKYGSASSARLPRRNLQNDMNQFAQIQRGIQLLCGFNNARQLFHRPAPLGQCQRERCKTREQFKLRFRFIRKCPLSVHLQNSHPEVVAAKRARPNS